MTEVIDSLSVITSNLNGLKPSNRETEIGRMDENT